MSTEGVSRFSISLKKDLLVHCLEVLVLRGKASGIKAFVDRLIAAKGVKQGRLILTTTGKGIPG